MIKQTQIAERRPMRFEISRFEIYFILSCSRFRASKFEFDFLEFVSDFDIRISNLLG